RCLADFVAPKSGPGAKPDGIGLFAVTAGLGVEKKERQFIADRDDCSAILLKALAVRLAMTPAASVSGFCLAHPDATCFNVGRIGEDLVADWARRMAMDEAQSRRGLAGVV
ncbi:MAG: vitamin B12 dependent-methionine synthase activation domain-containing protein, partial [Rubrivivax sp.]